ncbi:transposase [Methylohalobius crimeensis]|uniref:transposase n=1 Tax=Methylohalobius crimeensis TaxID=244365 RepID=UPI0003B40CED|nr:transposase [Methylohalobius crimeensis]
MNNPSTRMYVTVTQVLKQAPWRDMRHLSTVAWMIAGLLLSGGIGLSRWVVYVDSRARYAQSIERRFRRWLSNGRIDVNEVYAGLLKGWLPTGEERRVYVALDTTMLWNSFCVIQVALVYRGRAIPVAWKVKRQPSASVAFQVYRSVLAQSVSRLKGFEVILLADRGFCHLQLVRWIKRTPDWHCRIRMKRNTPAWRWSGAGYRPLKWCVDAGQVRYYHTVYLWKVHEAVNVAVGWEKGAKEPWLILSDEWTDETTLADYGKRFAIEEGFLDHKSNGFQWASSRLRQAEVLDRLCFVMAVATWIVTCQGTAVVAEGQRRTVDPHWCRGLSYARIGWNWIHHALACGKALIDRLWLPSADDPAPVPTASDRSRWMEELPWQYTFCIPDSTT